VTEPQRPARLPEVPALGPIPWDRPRRRPWLRVLVTLFLLGGSSCVGCRVVGSRASAEGNQLADKLFPAISQPWNADAIAERATPEFLSTTSQGGLVTFVSFLAARLGPLKGRPSFQSATWRILVGTTGFTVTTVHVADCQFEKAPARITLTLVRQNGVWRINGLHANADALLK